MKIKQIEFAGAVARVGGAPPGDLVQIAFSGRSNVGKSSLINRLLGRTRTPIAKVSSTPGKTQQINFFRVRVERTPMSHGAAATPSHTDARGPISRAGAGPSGTPGNERRAECDFEFFLVDLPGYGYARVPLAVRSSWKPLIGAYLRNNPRLAGVVQLIDARLGPTPEDLQMIDFLAALGVPALFALTKADKLKASERARQVERITNLLGAGAEQVVPFSARTGAGRDALIESLDALLAEGREGSAA